MNSPAPASTEFKGSDWARDFMPGITSAANAIGQNYANNPEALVYQGQRVADWTPWQSEAMNQAQRLAQSGSRNTNAASDYLANTMAGTGGTTNPYSEMDNPELTNMISQSNADITDAYGRGTGAQTAAAAAQGGAFGGSAFNETQGVNNRALADSLARNTSSLRSNQYNLGAQLKESQLGRQMSAAGMAPGFDANSRANTQAYGDWANKNYDVAQNMLNAAQQKFKDTSLAPAQGMDMWLNWLMQLNGAAGKTTQQISGSSPWATGAGLAALGGSIYNGL